MWGRSINTVRFRVTLVIERSPYLPEKAGRLKFLQRRITRSSAPICQDAESVLTNSRPFWPSNITKHY